MHRDVEELKKDLKEKLIVCPMPIYWAKICKILDKNNNQNIRIENPLILGGWGSSDKLKFERFIYHLSIAQELGVLHEITNYLDELNDKEFLYSNESKLGESLNEIGVDDLLYGDLTKVEKIIFPALNILKEIQIINPNITDEDSLYHLFLKNGFNNISQPKVKRGNSALIDLLAELGDIFDSQKDLREGCAELESFCFEIFWLKENN
tara:strand:+ start:178 stop:801 length:624 start_codon:yes stop_codon:yes gene_type:complete